MVTVYRRPIGWRQIGLAAVLLSGCAETRLIAEVEHKSAIFTQAEEYRTDMAAICLNVALKTRTEIEACASASLHDRQPYTENPVGVVRIRQILWSHR